MDAEFDFQEWLELAQRSPEVFEQRRREAIDAFLDASGEQRKTGLRLQREIDYEIRRADSPQQALSALSKMMWSQLAFLSEELEHLSGSMRELEEKTLAGAERLNLTLQAIDARR
jgi:phosphoserine phosphatase